MPGRTQLFSYLQSGLYPFLVLLQAHGSLFHHIVQSNIRPCNRFEFSHILFLQATTASHSLHYLLLDQIYVREVYFCSFVTQGFNRFIYKEFRLLMVTPFFPFLIPQTPPPPPPPPKKKAHTISTLPPSPKTSPGET